ncbi:ATP-binding protein [Vitiosangium sp. GDMCC 1.1324]|uniref:PAS domain-containing sensor histidine kinase n=1 Tax=Vitiosangium sp. (strain GDMCC 1.1324) TaxID=2138576 RepID=UPI001E37C3AA|nr:ATP-binding protein [Vitiosangium sp. GDMCC 1.1324]
MVARLAANDPHAKCQVGTGTLAPLAEALNKLSVQLAGGRTKAGEAFDVQALVEQAPNMMIACDPDGRIRFVNFTLPGLVIGDLLGTSMYRFIAPEDLDRVRGTIQRVLETGEPGGFDIRSVVKPGPEWFSAKLGAIKAEGQIAGFTMILTDISDLKQTQSRLERSNQELENFAYVASHDLQEPLRKIQTFGERLKSTSAGKLGPEGVDYLERMHSASTRMRRLIDDLLSFSRVASRAQPFTRVDLTALARDVVEGFKPIIEKTGAAVTVGTLPTLEADPTQLRQLLHHLLGNALKFHREDAPPTISIRGTLNADGTRCELAVEDDGIGFDEKYLDRIFNVFQRLHGRASKYDGTGIGLAICRKIVDRHNGSISARSTPGKGSTFVASLPLNQHSSR